MIKDKLNHDIGFAGLAGSGKTYCFNKYLAQAIEIRSIFEKNRFLLDNPDNYFSIYDSTKHHTVLNIEDYNNGENCMPRITTTQPYCIISNSVLLKTHITHKLGTFITSYMPVINNNELKFTNIDSVKYHTSFLWESSGHSYILSSLSFDFIKKVFYDPNYKDDEEEYAALKRTIFSEYIRSYFEYRGQIFNMFSCFEDCLNLVDKSDFHVTDKTGLYLVYCLLHARTGRELILNFSTLINFLFSNKMIYLNLGLKNSAISKYMRIQRTNHQSALYEDVRTLDIYKTLLRPYKQLINIISNTSISVSNPYEVFAGKLLSNTSSFDFGKLITEPQKLNIKIDDTKVSYKNVFIEKDAHYTNTMNLAFALIRNKNLNVSNFY